jgi:hypothetical protein
VNHDEHAAVAQLIARAGRLTPAEAEALDSAREAEYGDAVAVAVGAALDAIGPAAAATVWKAAWAAWCAGAPQGAQVAAADATLALAARGLIDEEHYRTLTAPWRAVIGEIDLPATGRNEQ